MQRGLAYQKKRELELSARSFTLLEKGTRFLCAVSGYNNCWTIWSDTSQLTTRNHRR
jgi:hypothetical protein